MEPRKLILHKLFGVDIEIVHTVIIIIHILVPYSEVVVHVCKFIRLTDLSNLLPLFLEVFMFINYCNFVEMNLFHKLLNNVFSQKKPKRLKITSHFNAYLIFWLMASIFDFN